MLNYYVGIFDGGLTGIIACTKANHLLLLFLSISVSLLHAKTMARKYMEGDAILFTTYTQIFD